MNLQHNLIYVFILVILPALLLFGCGKPRTATQEVTATPQVAPVVPAPDIDDVGTPTLKLPENAPGVQYKVPEAVVNKTNRQLLVLGRLRLSNTRIFYSSVQKKLDVTGHVVLNDSSAKKIAEKDFSLKATQENGQTVMKLIDEKDDATSRDRNMVVRAQANCMRPDAELCRHIVIDIYVSYVHKSTDPNVADQTRIYTEQIEVNRQVVDISEPEDGHVAPPQDKDAVPEEGELEEEGDDDGAIEGRYDGPAQNIDLGDLFRDPAPAPAPPVPAPPKDEKPEAKPKDPAKPSDPKAPPVAPSPKPPETPKPKPKPETPTKPLPEPEPVKPPLTIAGVKTISEELVQTADGLIRPYNQAEGIPKKGSLHNATSVLVKQEALSNNANFQIAFPSRKRYYATYEMAESLSRMGNELKKLYNLKLYVSDISDSNGGKVGSHKSHKMGTDADLGYPNDDGVKFPRVVSGGVFKTNNYSTAKTFNLFKSLFKQRDILVDRIFVDQKIIADLCNYAKKNKEINGPDGITVDKMFQNLQHIAGHGDHFHVRLRCSPLDTNCRSVTYRKIDNCD